MKQTEYLEEFRRLAEEKIGLTNRKNMDYANADDAFANFKLIEVLTNGKITTEEGILVRMTDKIQRVANLLYKKEAVNDEKINDTLQDLAIYSDILNICLKNKIR